MIDLHSHIIAEDAIENDNVDWEGVINIARMALEDGIEHVVWSPEYRVGQINAEQVKKNTSLLNTINLKLQEVGFPLTLTLGADFHIALKERSVINEKVHSVDIRRVTNSRYILLSFSQTYLPNNFESIVRELLDEGFVPIIAHPERFSWINEKYHVVRSLVDDGAWIQITADSFTGYFGRKAQYWAERFMTEGIIHVIASEAHSIDKRPPVLSEAKQILEANLSADEVRKIMKTRPKIVVNNFECSLDLLPAGVNYGWQVEQVS